MGENVSENVVVITGTEPDGALAAPRDMDGKAVLELRAAARVRRSAEGKLELDHTEGDALSWAERHRALAPLITLLLGPLDTLLFGNQLVALYGATEQSPEEFAIGQVAQAVPAGGSAVIADVIESDPQALDAAVAGLPGGGTLTRRPLSVVEDEIAAANQD